MGTCKSHPNTETAFICLKHKYYLCRDCLQCSDPQIYCKFRSSCVIFFLTEKDGDVIDREGAVHNQQSLTGE